MSILEQRRKCFEEHFQPHDGIEWCDRFGYHPKSTRIPSEFVALAGIAAMANGQLEAWNAALDHDESVLTLIEQNRELLRVLHAISNDCEPHSRIWSVCKGAISRATGEEA